MEEFYQFAGMVICLTDGVGVKWLRYDLSPYSEECALSAGETVCFTGNGWIENDTLFINTSWKSMQHENSPLSEIRADIELLPRWNKTTYYDFGFGEKVKIKEER